MPTIQEILAQRLRAQPPNGGATIQPIGPGIPIGGRGPEVQPPQFPGPTPLPRPVPGPVQPPMSSLRPPVVPPRQPPVFRGPPLREPKPRRPAQPSQPVSNRRGPRGY